jgi:hypothetical protein
MVRAIEQVSICLSLEEVTVLAGHEVLMKVEDSILMIVVNLQGI